MIAVALAWAASVEVEVEAIDATVTHTTFSRLQYTLGRAQDFYANAMGVRYPESLTVKVTIYGDRDAFRGVAREAGLPDWAGGFFKTAPGQAPVAALWTHDDRDQMIAVFLHEGSHFLLRYAGRTPRWLNEGFAQCFEHSAISGNLLTVRTPPDYAEFLRREGAGSAEALITDRASWNDLPARSVGPRYVRGWALTALMMSTDNGQETLKAILNAYTAERTQESGVAAVEATYRGGMAGLQRDFEAFARSPPPSTTIPRSVKTETRSDALWTTCPDGRLVSSKVGCGG